MADDLHRLRTLAAAQQIAPHVRAQVDEALRFPADMLSGIEKQCRFLVRVHLAAPMCPWCDTHVSYFEAVPEDAGYTLGDGCDALRCPHCGNHLRDVVPALGSGWFWGKRPEDLSSSRERGAGG